MRCDIGWITAVRRVLRLEALHRSPGFDQCAIDREVLARQQPPDPGLRQNRTQKLRCDLAIQKSVAVFRKGRVVPHRIVDASPTNQRNSRSNSSRSISWRSERTE